LRYSEQGKNMSNNEYFDRVASEWDSMRSEFFSEAVREAAMNKAQVQAGKTAADLGAGTGFVTAGLLQRGLRVVCVDHSEEMAKILKEKFGNQDFDVRTGEYDSLPIDDASVDYVFANMYLHHVDDPSKAIHEMARILRPGGRLVITDVDEHNHDFLLKEHHDRWPGFRREDVTRWFESAGLVNVSINCAGQDCCAASKDGSDTAAISIFVAYGEKG